ncbi:NUDIX domain-containing protein [Marinactinospora thermotolerans]|uniref:NUDIX domain-containing protein n=1 Tax=Marinactinospora thermotolerans DSM 45154 TaxID=1122192 RepID=A0A1T4T5V3_9ACTN|nr:NUDIX domain-containing protein [Marinactinospora thermotolerans]SKA35826.1 NUDIX domain-containing protein [Marinactinospora thermotolerans DSM 45154]
MDETVWNGCVVMITNRAGEILLQHRDDIPGICWPGHWTMPGGQQEPGETWEQTALREVREETGIVPEDLRELDVTPDDPAAPRPKVYTATWDGPESALVLGEGQALGFFPLDALPAPMPPHILGYIAHVQKLNAGR